MARTHKGQTGGKIRKSKIAKRFSRKSSTKKKRLQKVAAL